jgi:hypothetical protein
MSRLKERKEKARLIEEEPSSGLRVANLSVRPQRLAYLIDDRISEKEIIDLITYNTSIWGGLDNFFIPVHDSRVDEDWLSVLINFDPDKVVLCTSVDDEIISRVREEIQPYQLSEWSDQVIDDHGVGLDGFRSILMPYVLWNIYEEEKPITGSRIVIPELESASPYRLCANIQFGSLSENLYKIYTELLKAQTIECTCSNIKDYLDVLTRIEQKLSVLRMTEYYLTSGAHHQLSMMSPTFVLLGEEDSIEDLCVFWNARSSDRPFSKGVFAFPHSAFEDEKNYQYLGAWIDESIKGTNTLNITSANVAKDELIQIRDNLKTYLPDRIKMVDIWYDHFSFGRFRMHEPERREEIRFSGRALSLRTPKPKAENHIRGGAEWIVDIDLIDRSRFGSGFIPPRYSNLNHTLAGKPTKHFYGLTGYYIRASNDILSLRVQQSNDFIKFNIPEDDEILQDYLSSKDIKSQTTDKCRYARGMLNLLGGIFKGELLQDPGLRNLLYSMSRGASLTTGEMYGFFEPGGDGKKFQEIESLISDMTLKGILIRGYTLRCPRCDLRRWYGLIELSENMTCAGCLAALQPPLEAPFHYKLNELFVQGIGQGGVSLLLTALVLLNLGDESFIFVPGLEIHKESDRVDIDILATCNGQLVIAETKDLREGLKLEQIDELIGQLSSLMDIGNRIGASVVVFATLAEELPEEFDAALEKLREEYADIAVLVALRDDLERGYILGKDEKNPLTLFDIITRPSPQEDGRIIEPGQKMRSF